MRDRCKRQLPDRVVRAGGRRFGRGPTTPGNRTGPPHSFSDPLLCLVFRGPEGCTKIGDVPKSPVPVLTALVHVSEDKPDMRGIKAGWSPS